MKNKKIILINGRDLGKSAGGTKVVLEQTMTAIDEILTDEPKVEVHLVIPTNLKLNYKRIRLIKTKVNNAFVYDLLIMGWWALATNAQVVLGTKYISPPLPGFRRLSLVYDLGYFAGREYYPWIERFKIISLLIVGRLYTHHYLTISNHAKSELLKFLRLKPSQVSILNLGPGIFDHKPIQAKPVNKLPKKYILVASSNSKRKNLSRIIEAFKMSRTEASLVITGYRPKNDLQKNLVSSNRIVILGQVSPGQLIHLYQNANLFLYPSLYEGFGLPILEAQKAGVPVITSNLSSMPEVAGKGAYLIDPYSIDQISQAIDKISQDKILRQELIATGKANVAKYSWHQTATQLLNIFLGN